MKKNVFFYITLALLIIINIRANADNFQWAERIAGTEDDRARCIINDNSGNIYCAGYFSSDTLFFNNGIFLKNFGGSDIFVTKYNSNRTCQWAERIASSGNYDELSGIAIDSTGNLYISGMFRNNSINFNNGISLTNSINNYFDSFIAKYNSEGICQWAEKISGKNDDLSTEIQVDLSGNIFVTGRFLSDTTYFNNNIKLTNNSTSDDIFFAKYSSAGICQWAEKISSNGYDYPYGMAIDINDDVYILGSFSSQTLTFNNGISLINASPQDGFISKYNTNGICIWANSISGNESEYADRITVDKSGNTYISGGFNSNIANFGDSISLNNNTYNMELFLAKYNPDGICQWAEKISSNLDVMIDKRITSLATDDFGNVYLGGFSNSLKIIFNNGIITYLNKNSNYYTSFIAKYNPDGLCQWAERLSNNQQGSILLLDLMIDSSNNLFLTGVFKIPTLNLNNSGVTLTNLNKDDGFIIKFGHSETLTKPNLTIPLNNTTSQQINPILTWEPVTGATSYTLQVSLFENFESLIFVQYGIEGTELEVNGLNYASVYYWRVNARNNDETSDWSDVYYFKTKSGNITPICQWTEKISGSNSKDYIDCISYDRNGNIFVAGHFFSNTLSFNNGTTLTNINYLSEGYIAKFNSSGVCQWAEKIAGVYEDYVNSIDVDSIGNVFISGYFKNYTLNFNNGITLTNSGQFDGFLAKYNSNGICQWAQKIAGTSNDYVIGLAVRDSGNIYLTGNFSSGTLNFNNNITLTNSGSSDVFLAKYDSSGTCQWAEKIAGTGIEGVNSIAVNENGNINLFGYFNSSTLNYNNNITLTKNGSSDLFIAWYNSNGTCQNAQQISSPNFSGGACSIDIDDSSNVYISGYTHSSIITFNNGIEINYNPYLYYYGFIAKYNSSGLCQWAERTGTDVRENKIAVDKSGNVYFVGYYYASYINFNNGISITASDSTDAFFAAYNTDGVCQWADKIYGLHKDYANCIAIDKKNNIYIAGNSYSPNLLFNNGKTLSLDGAKYEIFFAKYSMIDSNQININNAWSLISSNSLPYNQNVTDIFKNNENVLFVKNNLGHIFSPSFGINQIGNWDITQGYQIYASSPSILQIDGFPVNPLETSINLNQGWNLVSYLRNSEIPISEVLQSILENLVFVKDSLGNTYNPTLEINTIGNMQPGQGYWIYMNAPAVLTYPGN